MRQLVQAHLRWNGKSAEQAGEQEANFSSHISNRIPTALIESCYFVLHHFSPIQLQSVHAVGPYLVNRDHPTPPVSLNRPGLMCTVFTEFFDLNSSTVSIQCCLNLMIRFTNNQTSCCRGNTCFDLHSMKS